MRLLEDGNFFNVVAVASNRALEVKVGTIQQHSKWQKQHLSKASITSVNVVSITSVKVVGNSFQSGQ